ncbi:MAG TPA: hypothetical protein VGA56_06440, partial [Opitutaceae bacterium]
LGRALLKQGVPVVVHEAQDYPRHRVCGEFICGLQDATIARLGLAPFFADASRYRTMAWHWKEKLLSENWLPSPAIGVSRHALDHRLACDFSQHGGDLRTGSRVNASDLRPGRVWATGRRAGAGEWIGLKVHCRGLVPVADLEFHLGRGAYVGASAVEDGAVNVCGLFRRRSDIRAPAASLLPAYLRGCDMWTLADRVESTAIPGTHAAVAAVNFDRFPPDDRPLVGDAFAMIPPFTGDGMAMAFEGADLATEPMAGYSRGRLAWDRAAELVRRRLHTRFRRRLALAGILQRFLIGAKGQACLAVAARGGFLPFRVLFQWLH